MRQLWHWFWRGFAMGCAELVPGISGMTVALLTGVYTTLVQSIALISRWSWWQLLLQSPREALRQLQFYNLLRLLLGMVLAVVLLAVAIRWLWMNQQHLLQAFFFGLVLVSALGMMSTLWRSERIGIGALPALLFGVALAVGLNFAGDTGSWPQGWLGWVLGGVLTSMAWLLPGLSGNLLLLVTGLYEPMLGMLASADFIGLLPFVYGVLLGMLALGRAVEYYWRNHSVPTRLLVVGMVLGSLSALLPPHWYTSTALVLLLGAGLGWLLVRNHG